ncbi:DEAD/DEAH box helicase [Emticicia sp. TH156]|uniref:DEAD/DEAH box helicase n=1 Tax=Emticicia sp. TH156 TaxID=2067454 RepID=UPI000C77ED4C|nr:ATP-binding domain-containing protein [Emticicia sp. TH156]PLK45015.1 ATP-dependent helicase [Emticicia sp. TH156]
MSNSLFYNHIERNELNTVVINRIEEFSNQHPDQQIYLLNAPLGEKYTYQYKENVIIILSPKYKIIFLDLNSDSRAFNTFYEDFIEDLSFLSDKYKYKNHIGRPRDWKEEITVKVTINNFDLRQLFDSYLLDGQLQRKAELLISLLIGSINDIEKIGAEEPQNLLDKVKKNILLFDGEQTRFIYKDFPRKSVSIQGLSGTGKTELLLHKLKELYVINDDAKIFLTCHNIALANTLKDRIPGFFNFMKVEKQIEWNTKLWVGHAWGSQYDGNSGLYSYLCSFYNIPFLRFGYNTSYETIFTQALTYINKIDESDFKYAFDYILIDERQDFPKILFELCERVARKKVFIAGDIFQDIFENTREIELNVDIILNRCYRTDPRTLMFAHAIGMKLFERKKLNWFDDAYWGAIGYKIQRNQGSREVLFSREPIRRFENLEMDSFESVIVKQTTTIPSVIEVLSTIIETHPTVTANDVAIIFLDNDRKVYQYIDNLCYQISSKLNWNTNRAFETKSKIENSIYITTPNHVKGLEFPFVLCLTREILDSYRHRNIVYTMLTRSFIQSYLLVSSSENLDILEEGLKTINEKRAIRAIEPTSREKEAIKNKLVKLQKENSISYKDFIEEILDEQKIDRKFFEKLVRALSQADIEKFDKEKIVKFIKANKEFYFNEKV